MRFFFNGFSSHVNWMDGCSYHPHQAFRFIDLARRIFCPSWFSPGTVFSILVPFS